MMVRICRSIPLSPDLLPAAPPPPSPPPSPLPAPHRPVAWPCASASPPPAVPPTAPPPLCAVAAANGFCEDPLAELDLPTRHRCSTNFYLFSRPRLLRTRSPSLLRFTMASLAALRRPAGRSRAGYCSSPRSSRASPWPARRLPPAGLRCPFPSPRCPSPHSRSRSPPLDPGLVRSQERFLRLQRQQREPQPKRSMKRRRDPGLRHVHRDGLPREEGDAGYRDGMAPF